MAPSKSDGYDANARLRFGFRDLSLVLDRVLALDVVCVNLRTVEDILVQVVAMLKRMVSRQFCHDWLEDGHC